MFSKDLPDHQTQVSKTFGHQETTSAQETSSLRPTDALGLAIDLSAEAAALGFLQGSYHTRHWDVFREPGGE